MRITLLALSALCTSAVHAATISTSTRQTINGIGASGAWWAKDLDLMPQDVRANVARLLFDQNNGLGLTDYRYNLGGGGVGVTTWARAPETPYVSDGKYNWTKDAGGAYFLRQAAQYQVPQLTLFVNSAVRIVIYYNRGVPVMLTKTRCSQPLSQTTARAVVVLYALTELLPLRPSLPMPSSTGSRRVCR